MDVTECTLKRQLKPPVTKKRVKTLLEQLDVLSSGIHTAFRVQVASASVQTGSHSHTFLEPTKVCVSLMLWATSYVAEQIVISCKRVDCLPQDKEKRTN